MKILFFLLAILFIYSQALAYNLPLPDNTTGEGEQQINLNNTQYTAEVYHSKLSEEEVASFYKDALAKQGFSLITEEKMPHSLHFVNLDSKEHIFMVLDARFGDETQVSVTSWHGDVTVYHELPAEINQDTPGSDVPGIPRYPQAVRISSVQNSEMKNACYKTSDNKEEIANFYENKMPLLSWHKVPFAEMVKEKLAQLGQVNNQEISEARIVFFEKGGRLLVIAISGECCGSKNNLVSILLTQERVLAD